MSCWTLKLFNEVKRLFEIQKFVFQLKMYTVKTISGVVFTRFEN